MTTVMLKANTAPNSETEHSRQLFKTASEK